MKDYSNLFYVPKSALVRQQQQSNDSKYGDIPTLENENAISTGNEIANVNLNKALGNAIYNQNEEQVGSDLANANLNKALNNNYFTRTYSTMTPQEAQENTSKFFNSYPSQMISNFMKSGFGMLQGAVSMLYKGAKYTGETIMNPVGASIKGAKAIKELAGFEYEGAKQAIDFYSNFFEKTDEAMESYEYLKNNFTPEDRFRIAKNFEDKIFQDPELSTIPKLIGGTGVTLANRIAKLNLAFAETIKEEPLETIMDLSILAGVPGFNSILKAPIKKLLPKNLGKTSLELSKTEESLIKTTKQLDELKKVKTYQAAKIGEDAPMIKTLNKQIKIKENDFKGLLKQKKVLKEKPISYLEKQFSKQTSLMRDWLDSRLTRARYASEKDLHINEWINKEQQIIKANKEAFLTNLTKKERELYPLYAKGTAAIPENISDNLKWALAKGRQLKKIEAETMTTLYPELKPYYEERVWGPLKARISMDEYGKLFEDLTDAEKNIINTKLISAKKSGIDPFYYAAIKKQSPIGAFEKKSSLSVNKPGFLKKYTGISEFMPNEFLQNPFEVMTRSTLAVNKYLDNVNWTKKLIKDYGKPVKFGDSVNKGWSVIAPEGYTKLFNTEKLSPNILEELMADKDLDIAAKLIGKTPEEVLTNLNINLENLISEGNKVQLYQIPNFIVKDMKKKLAADQFRQALKETQTFGDMWDVIKNNMGQAVLGKRGLRGAALDIWKKTILGYYPFRFIKNNIVGNTIFAAMQGISPKSFIESFKMGLGKGVYKDLKKTIKQTDNLELLKLKSKFEESETALKDLKKTIKKNPKLNSLLEDAKIDYEDSKLAYEEFRAKMLSKKLEVEEGELLGIKSRDYLPAGVESGGFSSEAKSLLSNLYSVEKSSPLTQKAFNVFNKAFNLLPDITFKTNTVVENFFRRASFYDEAAKLAKDYMKKTGKKVDLKNIMDEITTNPGIQESAMKQVNRFFGDYSKKSQIKQLYPFYSFYKHVFTLAMKYPLQFPLRAKLINELDAAVNKADQETEKTKNLPAFYQAQNNIPIKIGDKNYRLNITSSDPFNILDFNDIEVVPFVKFEPIDLLLTAFLKNSAPDVKVLAERLSGYNIFYGEEYKKWNENIRSYEKKLPDISYHILTQLPGYFDTREFLNGLSNWKESGYKEGGFQTAVWDSFGEKKKSKESNYTEDIKRSEWLEILKNLGIYLIAEDDYQKNVESQLDYKAKELLGK